MADHNFPYECAACGHGELSPTSNSGCAHCGSQGNIIPNPDYRVRNVLDRVEPEPAMSEMLRPVPPPVTEISGYVRVHDINTDEATRFEWPAFVPLPEVGDWITVGEARLKVRFRTFGPSGSRPFVVVTLGVG